MKKQIIIAALMAIPYTAEAAPLSGEYRLDFEASSGQCQDDVYVRAESSEVVTDIVSGRQPQYRIGWHCFDRGFGSDDVTTPDSCVNQVETNSLSDDHRVFESSVTSRINIDGVIKRRLASRFTLRMISEDRLEANLVGFDREGIVPQPYFRCVYDRTVQRQ